MNLVGAKATQYMFHKRPELHVLGQVPPGDNPNDAFNIRDRIAREAVFEEVDGFRNIYVGHLGDIYEVLHVRPDPDGDHVLHTTKGDLQIDYPCWGSCDLKHLPVPLVKVNLNGSFWRGTWPSFPERGEWVQTGNVQWVHIPVAVVEKLLVDSKLDKDFKFAPQDTVEFCGDMTVERAYEVCPQCNKLTWIVYFRYRPNQHAEWQSEWAGGHFPDGETARRIGEQWVKYRGQTKCGRLSSLKVLFPGHPVIPLVEEFERAEKEKRSGSR